MNQQTDRASQRDRPLKPEPAIRQSKRRRIVDMFTQNLGRRYDSRILHIELGSGLRARIAEINADPTSPIRILNRTTSSDTGEVSIHWSERREGRTTLPRLRKAL